MSLPILRKAGKNRIKSSFNNAYGVTQSSPLPIQPKPVIIPEAKRTLWYQPMLGVNYSTSTSPPREACSDANASQANLVSSKTNKGTHMPAIDIDFPARLEPSSTPGHFHLYLEKEMPWIVYNDFLHLLYQVGVIEKDFYDCSVRDEQSFLRVEHNKPLPETTREMDSETLINKAGASISEVRQLVTTWMSQLVPGEVRYQRYEKVDKVLHSVEKILKEAL